MKAGNKLNEDKFKTRLGITFTNDLEIYLANSNLSNNDKIILIDFIERAFELGNDETNLLESKQYEFSTGRGSYQKANRGK